jgi:hypothetical protein
MRAVLGANLAWGTDYPNWRLSQIPLVPPGKYWDSGPIRPWPLPSKSFPINYSLLFLLCVTYFEIISQDMHTGAEENNEYNCYLGQDSNRSPSEYKPKALLLEITCFVKLACVFDSNSKLKVASHVRLNSESAYLTENPLSVCLKHLCAYVIAWVSNRREEKSCVSNENPVMGISVPNRMSKKQNNLTTF